MKEKLCNSGHKKNGILWQIVFLKQVNYLYLEKPAETFIAYEEIYPYFK